jgi:hypothetical protein
MVGTDDGLSEVYLRSSKQRGVGVVVTCAKTSGLSKLPNTAALLVIVTGRKAQVLPPVQDCTKSRQEPRRESRGAETTTTADAIGSDGSLLLVESQ